MLDSRLFGPNDFAFLLYSRQGLSILCIRIFRSSSYNSSMQLCIDGWMDRIFVDRERPIPSDILRSFMCWTDHAVRSLTNLVYCFASFFLDIRFYLRFNSPIHLLLYVYAGKRVIIISYAFYVCGCICVCVCVCVSGGKESGCLLFFPLPNMNS